MCIITFKDLAWTDQVAHLKDISSSGVGLESVLRMDRGFVWFKDRVAGHRSGVLLWSRLVGSQYRAGVQLVPLTRDQEAFICDEVTMVRARQPLRNPEAIIATIMGSLGRRNKQAG
jgi:hypothetical protein